MRAASMRYRVKGTGLYVQPQASTGLSSPFQTTGSGRRSVNMRASNYGPNAALDYSAQQLRDQAREADRKNWLASTAADRFMAHVVGTGIVPQPANENARKLFLAWTDHADSTGQLDFYGLQAQVARAMFVSGECFIRLRTRRPQDRLSVPLQIQVLESDYCPMDKNDVLPSGGYIRQGVEFDKLGRRVAYWLYRQHPADRQVLQFVDFEPTRVPVTEVLHVYDAMTARPGQVRGIPWMTRALAKIRDLDSYDDAELVRKRVSALLVGFVRKNLPDGVSADDLAEIWGDDAEIENGVGIAGLEPGSIQYGEPGESIEWSNPQDVGGQYAMFFKQQLMAISASAGLLYEQLSGNYSDGNDRTWRAAFNEFRRRCEMWQHHLIVYMFCRPVWTRWVTLARMSGALRPAEAPETVPWVAAAWPYIHPVQDVQSKVLAIRNGIDSRTQVNNGLGQNSAQIDADQAADNARADRLGLRYDSDARYKESGGKDNSDQSSKEKDESNE